MVGASASQEFHWSETGDVVGQPVVQPNGVTLVRPMEGNMDHKSSGHIHNSLNGPFSVHILVLGTHAQKGLPLVLR